MLRNYLKTAYRSLVRDKLYSAISIIGLSIGIACCLLIFLYVKYELSFDGFHSDAENIFRVIQSEGTDSELSAGTPSTSALLRQVLIEAFPEVKRATRIAPSRLVVSKDEKSFSESVLFADPDFVVMFSFPLKLGDPASVLDDPGSVVLTPELARKYFGDRDPIGEVLSIQLGDTVREFSVSGMIESAPVNSSIQYDLLIPMELFRYTVPEGQMETWDIVMFSTYIQLHPGSDVTSLEDRMSSHVGKLSGYEEEGVELSYALQPLRSVHLDARYDGEAVASSDPLYSFILGGIAFAVLLIACINFTSLAIGRSSGRTREVGLRKVLGAGRGQLMRQFWGEALLLSTAALVLGIGLAEALLPMFNELAQTQLSLGLLSDWTLPIALVSLALITAFMAGLYPAILISRFLPIDALSGNAVTGRRNRLIQGLIVLQFTISVFLVISTLVMSSQMSFIQRRDLGFDRELVVVFPTGTEGEKAATLIGRLRTEVADEAAIVDVSGYSYRFGQSWLYINLGEDGTTVLIGEDVTGPGYASTLSDPGTYFYINWVDAHYVPTMGITIAEGRNFSEEHPSDAEGAIIINQTAARLFGLDDPVGGKLPKGFSNATIIGVVEDFHYYPLHREIEPLVLHMSRNDNLTSLLNAAVRIRRDRIPEAVSILSETWSRVSDGMPFDYEFLDSEVEEQYAADERWWRIVEYSSALSILITCLGLFGLASLAVAKRTREIGIRKVLGASAVRLVATLTTGFAKHVLVANVLAWPAAYLVMNSWLEGFAYRTSLGVYTFLIAGALVLVVALVAVSCQATKAALSNPVDAIRSE